MIVKKHDRHFFPVAVLTALFVACAIPRLYFPDLDHGDEFLDADVLNAGANYVKFGFIACRFLPILERGLDTPENPYTHFPPLPQIFNGVLRLVFLTDSLVFFRIVGLLLSWAHLLLWYACIARFTGSRMTAFVSAVMYLSNPFFIFGMDAVSHVSLSDFLRILVMYLFLRNARGTEAPSRRDTIILWLCVAAASLATFEYIIYLSFFFVLCKLVFFRRQKNPSWLFIAIMWSAPVAAFAVRVLLNAWYFGSIEAAVNDLMKNAAERIASTKEIPVDRFTIGTWWQYVVMRNISLAFVFNLFILCILIFCGYVAYRALPAQKKARVAQPAKLCMALFVCGMTWYVFFPSHSFAHTFVLFLARHLTPAAALWLTLVAAVFYYLPPAHLGFLPFKRGVLALALGIIVLAGIRQSDLPVTRDSIRRAEDFLIFKQALLALREASRPNDTVGVNYHRFPFMGYYTQRRFLKINDTAALESQGRLPRYFIFIPYEGQMTRELLDAVQKKYALIAASASKRFPALFFALKE